MQGVMAFFVGIGLSATCGFRIFVPLLGLSIAHHAGYITLSHGFEWIGSWPATIAFAVAMIIEVIAYYIPWVDNLLDTIATPAAVVAGAITTASVVGDVSPLLRWPLELLASIVGTIVSIVLPVVAIVLVALIMFLIFRRILRRGTQPAS
jgi:hypothetical protein